MRATRSCHPAVRPRLKCADVWGGIRNLDREIAVGAVSASLHSASADGGKGGDIYFFGVCKGCRITRLAIADVVGHGEAVSDVSQYVYDALKAHICDLDSRTILSDINERVGRHGLSAMTTAAVVAFHPDEGQMCVSYAGHPPALVKRRSEGTWWFAAPTMGAEIEDPPRDLPLAVAAGARYGQLALPMTSGDRVFVYTDGVTEAPSPDGRLLGGGGLKRVLDEDPDRSLSETKDAVLHALEGHTRRGLTHDDVTLIALEIC